MHTFLKINRLGCEVVFANLAADPGYPKNVLTIQFTRTTKSKYLRGGPGELVFFKSDHLILKISQIGELYSHGHLVAFIL